MCLDAYVTSLLFTPHAQYIPDHWLSLVSTFHILYMHIYCTLNHNKNKPTKTKSAYSVPKHLMKASSASLLRSKKQYCIHWSFIVHYTRTKTAILSSYLQFFTQHRARPEFSYFISGMTKIFKTIKTSHCVWMITKR